jgi:hypothetical protein
LLEIRGAIVFFYLRERDRVFPKQGAIDLLSPSSQINIPISIRIKGAIVFSHFKKRDRAKSIGISF